MTPLEILRQSAADGVQIIVSHDGNLRTAGIRSSVEKWLSAIRDKKADIVDYLTRVEGGGDLPRAVQTAALLVDLVPEADAKITAALDDLLRAELSRDPAAIRAGVVNLELLVLRVWRYYQTKAEERAA
ncbi:MAG TPA: hypothetical protein PKO06_12870 [Candidatus Ozemobacteraceae bacterium]|nr:hypothetical protein [Candidatus Ozemobacteraceae bacterium]